MLVCCFCPDSPSSLWRVAERGEERLVTVPGSQDLCQILQDVGDDVYQQYRLTRQGSDFDSQSAFHINVSLYVHRKKIELAPYPTFLYISVKWLIVFQFKASVS